MTKRQNAARFYHHLLETRAAPRHFRTGADVEATLAKLPQYKPIMCSSMNTRCYACDELIGLAHTCFVADSRPHASPVLCFSCGVGWCIYSGSHPVEYFDSLPAIGGPAT